MLGSTHGTLTTDFRARVDGLRRAAPGRPSIDGGAVRRRRGDLDVSGRPLYADVPDLDRFFRPESVAVVGASDAEGRPEHRHHPPAHRLGRAGRRPAPPGAPDPRRRLRHCPAPPPSRDLPEQVDLAVLLVADPLPVIEELAEAKVKFAVAFASGFAETGDAGAAAQARLAAAVQRSGPAPARPEHQPQRLRASSATTSTARRSP